MFRSLLVLLVLTTRLAAQECVVALEVRSTVTLSRSSAVIVSTEPNVMLLTAQHAVVKDLSTTPTGNLVATPLDKDNSIEVYIKNGWYKCSLLRTAADCDVAVLEVVGLKHALKHPISIVYAEKEYPVSACGFVMGMDRQRYYGKVVARNTFQHCDVLELPSDSVTLGMSGGAVLDRQGNVCGIISSVESEAPWRCNYTNGEKLFQLVREIKYRSSGPVAVPQTLGRAVPRFKD